MILLKGPPGCGKSTIATALARRLGYALIDKDDINDILQKALAPHTPVGGELAGGLAYTLMFTLARRLLLSGSCVICDSPLTTKWAYESAREVASKAQARVAIVDCYCSDEQLWRLRIENRGGRDFPPHRIASWDQLASYRTTMQTRYADSLVYAPTDPCTRIDTAKPLEGTLDQVECWLNG
jgi:predicted kinase